MPLSDNMRKMIDLARARAATIALLKRIAQRPATPAAKSDMLTESRRERLQEMLGKPLAVRKLARQLAREMLDKRYPPKPSQPPKQ